MAVVVPTGLEGLQEAFATLGAGLGAEIFKEEIRARQNEQFLRENPQLGALFAPVLDAVDQQILDQGIADPTQIAALQRQAVQPLAELMGFGELAPALAGLGEAFRSARGLEERADVQQAFDPGAVAAEVQTRGLETGARAATAEATPAVVGAQVAEAEETVESIRARQALEIPLLQAKIQRQILQAQGAGAQLEETLANFRQGLAEETAENFDKLSPDLQELFAISNLDPNVLNALLTREEFNLQRELQRMRLKAQTQGGIDPISLARLQLAAGERLDQLVQDFNEMEAGKQPVTKGALELQAARINSHLNQMQRIMGPMGLGETFQAEARAITRRFGFDIVGFDVQELDVNPNLVSGPEQAEVLRKAVSLGVGAGLDPQSALQLAKQQSDRFASASADPAFQAEFLRLYNKALGQAGGTAEGTAAPDTGSFFKRFLLSEDPADVFEALVPLVGAGSEGAIGQAGVREVSTPTSRLEKR